MGYNRFQKNQAQKKNGAKARTVFPYYAPENYCIFLLNR